MQNQKMVFLMVNQTVTLIEEIQNQLKMIKNSPDQMKYLVLTELYSLRTRTYIVGHELQFFELDQEISELEILNNFKLIKSAVAQIDDLFLLKKITFLISMLIASVGVGETESTLNILKKISSLKFEVE